MVDTRRQQGSRGESASRPAVAVPSLNLSLRADGLSGMAPLLATAIPLGVDNFLEAMGRPPARRPGRLGRGPGVALGYLLLAAVLAGIGQLRRSVPEPDVAPNDVPATDALVGGA